MTEKKPAQLMSIKDGNEEKLHIRTTSSVVSLDRTNPKLPENIYDIQALANALGKLAFLDDTVDPPEPEPEPPLPCKNLKAVATQSAIQLTWEDPNDDTWASTRIVRKTGGYPTSETDGTIVTTTYTKNQYQSSPFVDDGLSSGVTYYYRAFSCSSKGIFNTEDQVTASATIKTSTYKIMTVKIDLYDSNPQTCGSFADDALAMPYGKESAAIEKWHEFFGYKPCLFKNGAVVGYLNPNNYGEYEDGSYADITSGNSGDVMVEFPRRGIKMYNTSNHLVISMTDNPDDPDFTYYAHTRGNSRKENFYVGAYPCGGDTMGSISGAKIRTGKFQSFKEKINSTRPTGYQLMTFYQWTYFQVMYLLQFKGNFNVEKTNGQGGCAFNIGDGYLGSEVTGKYDKEGLFFGLFTQAYRSKLFGMEDLYGTHAQLIDGILRDDSKPSIYLATDNFSSDGYPLLSYSEYINTMPVFLDGFITETFASAELGFIPKTTNHGSSSTYYCDYVACSDAHPIYTVGYCYIGNYTVYSGLFAVRGHTRESEASFTRISYY